MTENILGIDLGTSSVKLILGKNGTNIKAREGYSQISTDAWWDAICRAAK
jgi:sugar (pentulose or hexulose) kinase